MGAKFKGAQSVVSSFFPQALYVHCVSHALNLAPGNATDIQSIRNSIGIMENIYSFLNTPKKNEVFQRMISVQAAKSRKAKLVPVCPTRWVERHASLMAMVELLDAVCYTLQELITWQDINSSSSATNLMDSILEPPFIISLYTLQKLFSYTLP
jgi:hypothetical protein